MFMANSSMQSSRKIEAKSGVALLFCSALAAIFLILTPNTATAQTAESKPKSAPSQTPPPAGPAGIQWVFIKGGTFKMGDTAGDEDEKPVHTVTVSDFYLSKTEVTVAQFRAFCEAKDRPMPSSPKWGEQDLYPIVYVSWEDANRFCKWAEGRLPTEAEWEYAAKGGSRSGGFQYSGSNALDEVAWYQNNSGKQMHAVGTKKPNELGLFDMNGNAWEWCSDWFGENYYQNSPSENPQGPDAGECYVLRGGCWSDDSKIVRCSNRIKGYPDFRNFSIGFRIARTP
jgi:formylglycine-generating enzyme